MNMTGLGDAARYRMLQQDGTRLREALQRLTGELSSGRHGDLGRAMGGDFAPLADVERSLHLTGTFARTIAEAGMMAGARQTALGRIEAEIDGLAPHLLGLAAGGSLQDVTLAIADAGERLDLAVTTLNTRLAGQSLFSGNTPDRAALIPAEEMLAHLRPLVAGAATAQDMVALVEDWFLAPGGGYDGLAWRGGAGAAGPGDPWARASPVDNRHTPPSEPALRGVLAGLGAGRAHGSLSGGGARPPPPD